MFLFPLQWDAEESCPLRESLFICKRGFISFFEFFLQKLLFPTKCTLPHIISAHLRFQDAKLCSSQCVKNENIYGAQSLGWNLRISKNDLLDDGDIVLNIVLACFPFSFFLLFLICFFSPSFYCKRSKPFLFVPSLSLFSILRFYMSLAIAVHLTIAFETTSQCFLCEMYFAFRI